MSLVDVTQDILKQYPETNRELVRATVVHASPSMHPDAAVMFVKMAEHAMYQIGRGGAGYEDFTAAVTGLALTSCLVPCENAAVLPSFEDPSRPDPWVHSSIFIPTHAYDRAREKLHQYHFVVLEGPPEMGKTTIGRVIALSQLSAGWDSYEVRRPSEVLGRFVRDQNQVFVADDFSGRTEYEPALVSEWQAELAHILPKLDSKHWLILTSRAHLLEMAKPTLDIAGQNQRFPSLGEVVVDASALTTAEKARILYRHAKSANLTREHQIASGFSKFDYAGLEDVHAGFYALLKNVDALVKEPATHTDHRSDLERVAAWVRREVEEKEAELIYEPDEDAYREREREDRDSDTPVDHIFRDL